MTEHADDRRGAAQERLSTGHETGAGTRLPEPIPTDVVFDFTGIDQVDVSSLSLLLTAGHLAHEDDRNVWITAVPDQAWHVLHALGLEGFFLPFPDGEETAT